MDWRCGVLRVVMDWRRRGSPYLFCAAFLRCLLAVGTPAGFWCRQVGHVVPLAHCRSRCALGVSRGCFHCAELHACDARHFGTRPPCHIRRFQLSLPRAVTPRLGCTCDAPPLRAGSSCTMFNSSLYVFCHSASHPPTVSPCFEGTTVSLIADAV